MYSFKNILFFLCVPCLFLYSCSHNHVKDVDGNSYNIVKIGEQVWMKEDLKTTHFNDGSAITMVGDYEAWTKNKSTSFCFYNNDTVNKANNSSLYNFYTVASNKICPQGWHVPSAAEWEILSNNLSGTEFAGGFLKEKGSDHWKSPNTDATDLVGFKALPGGYRSYNGSFSLIGKSGYWWSSTNINDSIALFFNMRYKSASFNKYRALKTNGFCIRCLMDKKTK